LEIKTAQAMEEQPPLLAWIVRGKTKDGQICQGTCFALDVQEAIETAKKNGAIKPSAVRRRSHDSVQSSFESGKVYKEEAFRN
jgi:ribosomal protein S5